MGGLEVKARIERSQLHSRQDKVVTMTFKEIIKKYALEVIVFTLSVVLYVISLLNNLNLTTALIIINLAIIAFRFFNEISAKKELTEHYVEARFTSEKIKELDDYINNERVSLLEKQTILTLLIRHGLVDEKDVIKNLKQQSFVSLFCYQKPLPAELQEHYDNDQRPVLKVIGEAGFVRLGKRHNFYIIPAKYLPEELQDIKELEAFLNIKIQKEWNVLLDKTKQEAHEIYEKYKDRDDVFNFSYFITKSFYPNLAIGFINFCCFSKDFMEEYSKFIKLNKLKINKAKIAEFMKLLTIDLLTDEIPSEDRQKIDEDDFKKKCQVNNFIDFGLIEQQKIEEVLSEIFERPKANAYATQISIKAKKYAYLLKEIGVV